MSGGKQHGHGSGSYRGLAIGCLGTSLATLAIIALFSFRGLDPKTESGPSDASIPPATIAPAPPSLTGLDIAELTDRLIQEAARRGQLLSGAGRMESETLLLQSSLNRLQSKADKSPERSVAFDAIVRNGDLESLQRELIRLAEAQDRPLTVSTWDDLQLCREIIAVNFLRGNLSEAENWLKIILAAYPNDADANNKMGHIHVLRCEWDAAIHYGERVLAAAKDDPIIQATAYTNLGLIYGELDEWNKAEEMHLKALEIRKVVDLPNGLGTDYSCLGHAHWQRGDIAKAEEMYLKALAEEERLGHQEETATLYDQLAKAYWQRGDLAKAEDALVNALRIAESLRDTERIARLCGNLGAVYSSLGQSEKSVQMHRRALAQYENLGMRENIARQCFSLGMIYGDQAEFELAEGMFRNSLKLCEELGLQEDLAASFANLGETLHRRGDFSAARELWVKSRGIYAQIGLDHKAREIQGWIDNLPR